MKLPVRSVSCFFLAVLSVTFKSSVSQIVLATGGNFEQDGACGTTKTCFSDCSGSAGCTYEAACSSTDGITAECTITAKVGADDTYLALAFSSDQSMGDDSVTGCKYYDSSPATASIFNAKNEDKTPVEYSDNGVELTSFEKTSDILRCVFTREMATGVDGKRFDLSQSWYWFMATGDVTSERALAYHGTGNRFVSSQMYVLASTGLTGPTDSSNPGSTQAQVGTAILEADSSCGTTKICFSDCASGTCSYQIACAVVGDNAECDIAGNVAGGDVYIAWALSDNDKMGNDTVIGCKSINDMISAYNSINEGYQSIEYQIESGISLISSSLADGVLRCKISRPLTSGSQQFGLSQPWYWLFATGSVTASVPGYHQTTKYASTQEFDLSLAPDQQPTGGPPATDPPPNSSGSVEKSEDCGDTEGCFTRCESDISCVWTVAWSVDSNGEFAIYSISSDVGTGGTSWIGLGFSADGDMGDDDVIGCAGETGGNVQVFSGLTSGDNVDIYTDNDVDLESGSLVDGKLSCRIQRRVNSYTVGDKTRRDLNEPWTLLVARGSGSINQDNTVSISYHGANNRFISPRQVSASELVDLAATEEDYPLIKAHGALMIGAWVFLASIGIVAARYYKPVLGGDLCSQKQWFQIHRTAMVLVFCACVAGFVIIFVETKEWVEIKQTPKYLEGHPIMGVIVTGLCVINPLMALIRPHPGTKNRPIFNWAHWFVGTAAHILGVVTIFFGFELDKSDAPDYLKYILAGYAAWQVFIELTLEIMTCCCNKKDRSEMYELTDRGNSSQKLDGKSSDGLSSVKKGIFLLHFFVVSAISAVLIGLLVVGKKELDK